MGNDLVGACLFCAGLLLGVDLAPPIGWNAELGAAYSSIGRRLDLASGTEDASRVIGRFGLIGIGANRAARDGLGAGTPELEWKVRVALAPSRSDQSQSPSGPGQTSASGDGRFENYALLVRLPLSPRDSIEATGTRKNHDSTEQLRSGGEGSVLGGSRTLGADRIDVALGWRHRWRGLEGSAAAVYVQADGTNGTRGAFHLSGGGIFGGALEARARVDNWTFVLGGQRASGSVDATEQSLPSFVPRHVSSNASLEAYRLGAGWSGRSASVFLSGTYDRTVLPFVSEAVLGTEAVAFEHGFHPSSREHHFSADLVVRGNVGASIFPRAFLRWSRGDETVVLSDPTGVLPAQRLDIRRSAGFFGSPSAGDITVGLAAEVSLPGF
ncbi:MAG TPA: hypothetical protein VK780_10625 [Thermoanaerobaculia bacterium]|jgi:hypothetical protein|nr:hypothetical protein [Thermoanaerobaculia bacterium]